MYNQAKVTFPQGKKEPVTVDLLQFIFKSSGNGDIRSIDLPDGKGVANVDITKYSLTPVEVDDAPAPVAEAPAQPEAPAEGQPAPAEVEQGPAAKVAAPADQPAADKKGGKGGKK